MTVIVVECEKACFTKQYILMLLLMQQRHCNYFLLVRCHYKALNRNYRLFPNRFFATRSATSGTTNRTKKIHECDQRQQTETPLIGTDIIRIWEFHGSSFQDRKPHLYEAAVLQKGTAEASILSDSDSDGSNAKSLIQWRERADIDKFSSTFQNNQNNHHANKNAGSSGFAADARERIIQKAIHLFLPHGYPHTVDAGYAQYVTFCFCSSVAGSAAMVLSMQALLHAALGISTLNSSVLSAGVTWVIKDGIGQLGGILFASKIGQTRGLDSNPKRWRMLSAMAMDASTFLEICTPMFPGYFLLIASVANVGKNVAFLSASASKAALHQSLQLTDSSNNLADITAKAGSQAIFASLFGTTLGIGLSTLIGSDFGSVASGFVVLSVIHQSCTYQALKAVRLRSFSRHRMHILLDHFVCSRQKNETLSVIDSVLSPEDVANLEVFFPIFEPDDSHRWLKVGCNLKEICLDERTFEQMFYSNEKYVLNMVACDKSPSGYQVRLAFLDGATGKDLIRGELHGYFFRSLFLAKTSAPRIDTWSMQSASYKLMTEDFDEFFIALQNKRWHTDDEYVNIDGNRACRLAIDVSLLRHKSK